MTSNKEGGDYVSLLGQLIVSWLSHHYAQEGEVAGRGYLRHFGWRVFWQEGSEGQAGEILSRLTACALSRTITPPFEDHA